MYVGLGQTIPWQCWDSPGFKACHSVQWRAATEMCNTPGGKAAYEGDVPRCVEEQTYLAARKACFVLCPSSKDVPVPIPMTEEEIEEAGGRPESRGTPWRWIAAAAVGAVIVGTGLFIAGVGVEKPARA